MIRFQRSLRARGGKAREAIVWARELTAYLNGKFTDAHLEVFSHRFGDINTLTWQADFDSLASLDGYQRAAGADSGYWALIDKSQGLYLEDSIQDTILESI
jgi:hypothetical protein